MQEETSQTETETIVFTDWEFKFDGSFVEKPMPEIRQYRLDVDLHWITVLGNAGWLASFEVSRCVQPFEVRILRKDQTTEFLIDLHDWDSWGPGLGLVYCANLPTLLEFFRRYESFLLLGRSQELSNALLSVNRYLFDRRDGLAAVKRVEAREEEAEYRRRYARQAQADQETSN